MQQKNFRKRIYEIIQVGNRTDLPSTAFDIFIVIVILLNISVTVFETFDVADQYHSTVYQIECLSCFIFAIEYIFRVYTADFLYPKAGPVKSRLKFVGSFYGLIDLLSFLPFFLPFMSINLGIVAFRMLRVLRIFRLFRINSQYDAFNVVTDVLKEKWQQLLSSVCMICIMMLASSLCMYSLEHEAQPEIFHNAFSGIWWSVSTLLTVGYGDIYPITVGGQIMAIIIAFLGVGLVAIPTGIISAGFVEQYTKKKSLAQLSYDNDMKFLMISIEKTHPWVENRIKNIPLPPEFLIVAVIRNENEVLIPNGDTLIREDDRVVIGALEYNYDIDLELREVNIREEHKWANKRIRDLELPKNHIIVSIYRSGEVIIPKGNVTIIPGDLVSICEKRI